MAVQCDPDLPAYSRLELFAIQLDDVRMGNDEVVRCPAMRRLHKMEYMTVHNALTAIHGMTRLRVRPLHLKLWMALSCVADKAAARRGLDFKLGARSLHFD